MDKKDIVLITGAAGNIGKAVIQKYLDNNCIVVASDIKEEFGDEKIENNKNFNYYRCDVTNVEDIKSLKQIIEEKYNRITHIISMAGDAIGTDLQGIENVTIEDINKTIQLNLASHIYVTTVLLPLIKKESLDKTITYVSSINALRAYDAPVYSASKAALYGFTNGILNDMGNLDIRVNIITPGTVLRPHEQLKNQLTNGEYAKKRPQPKYRDFALNTDIADSLYCITHIMKKMVGQDIVIDAGQMA